MPFTLGWTIPFTQRSRNVAEQLVRTEFAHSKPSSEAVQFAVCEKLRSPLSSLAGTAGFQALLSRSLKLMKADLPRFNSLTLTAEGTVGGVDAMVPPVSAEETVQAEATLIAHIIELIRTFLGEALALRLLQDTWPGVSFKEGPSEKGETS